MKYVKTFEQLDYGTAYGKAQAMKNVQRTNTNNTNFRNQFYKEYPKGTTLFFEDKESEYELVFTDIKFTETGHNLLFKAENGYKITITNPFNISEDDLEKISILPLRIKPESKQLIENMLNYK